MPPVGKTGAPLSSRRPRIVSRKRAAQRRQVGLGLELGGVEDHEVGHRRWSGSEPRRDRGVALGAGGDGLRDRTAVLRRDREDGVDLPGARGAEIRRDDLGAAVVAPTSRAAPSSIAVSCMKPSPWPLAAYSGSISQNAFHSPRCHISTTCASSCSRKGLQIRNAYSGARPFCAKRWLKRAAGEEGDRAVVMLLDARRIAQPRRALSAR